MSGSSVKQVRYCIARRLKVDSTASAHRYQSGRVHVITIPRESNARRWERLSIQAPTEMTIGTPVKALMTVCSLIIVGALVSAAAAYYGRPTFGQSCQDGCRSGFCYSPKGCDFFCNYCTHDCDDATDCPSDYSCVSTQGRTRHFCRRDPRGKFGEQCSFSEECLSGICATLQLHRDGAKKSDFIGFCCVMPCGPAGQCPKGADCHATEGSTYCAPIEQANRDADIYYARPSQGSSS
jgi:hypothetical protein